MIADKIAQARQLDAEATPGPWVTSGRFVDAPPRGQVAEANGNGERPCVENARLIAHARNHHAALWGCVEALQSLSDGAALRALLDNGQGDRVEAMFAALRALAEVG